MKCGTDLSPETWWTVWHRRHAIEETEFVNVIRIRWLWSKDGFDDITEFASR
jgi:hypothetical protein